MIFAKNNALIYKHDNETMHIQAWGENALRVRATQNIDFTPHDWALLAPSDTNPKIQPENALIANGKIAATVSDTGVLTFCNANGKILLKENWERLCDEPSKALHTYGRSYLALAGDTYKITQRFVADDDERIFGMGQYQQKYMNMKGCVLELAQRNSQVTVPFYVSNLGYGFLWNNPGIGKVFFGKNGTEWVSEGTKQLDYWIVAGDSPDEIMRNYMAIVGKPPMMPDYAMGFWQCKLRYRTQDELLTVARKHKALDLPMDVIVADFFHWTMQGEYKFDPRYWPDVEGMCRELNELGIKLMVSVWPTVDYRSENFELMMEKGYLARVDRGQRIHKMLFGDQLFFDFTNPEARAFIWQKCKENYLDKGVTLFWLDVAEPEYMDQESLVFRYCLGSVSEVGNVYPLMYTKAFYDGQTSCGNNTPIHLVRSAWAGSARFGALVWSGDIDCTFDSFQRQVRAGLSMAMAGIPWWTTDIGGFHGASIDDPEFVELLLRWFAYSCFSPVFRLHGNRLPETLDPNEVWGTGADNEVWSYGDDAFNVMKKFLLLRERLRPYIKSQMEFAASEGVPPMRPLLYDFPNDNIAWDIDDEYMFGPDLLVAPIMERGATGRNVYLPEGACWTDMTTGEKHDGGIIVAAVAPIDVIPVFLKNDANVLM